MTAPRFSPILPSLAVALLLGFSPARALLNLDGQRNQVFVFGSATFGYDSNVFSDHTDRGDYSMGATFGAELRRRAGIISVNAIGKVTYTGFDRYSDENSFNPNFQIEFLKSTGRTTGQFSLSAYRENRSDSAVNLRTSSWNFPAGLSLKYPVNERYYLTSETGYLRRRYVDTTTLANLTDYSQAVDVFYVYTSKLDLMGGYRIRILQTSVGDDTYDHWFNIGATGSLFAKLNGTVRVGYQIRDVTGATDDSYAHLNALASVTWPVTRKLSLIGAVSRDFNTIATGASVDSLSASLRATYAFTRRIEFNGGLSSGRNRFLGTPPPMRRDTFFGLDVGAAYRLNDHLNVGATYTYFRNWSTFAFSDFDRQVFSVDISSRY